MKRLHTLFAAGLLFAAMTAPPAVSFAAQDACEKKEQNILAAYERAITRYTSKAEKLKARALAVKESQTARLESQIERAEAKLEELFNRCINSGKPLERCESLKAKHQKRVDRLYKKFDRIDGAYEKALARVDKWFEKVVAKATARRDNALEKLAARCDPPIGPTG